MAWIETVAPEKAEGRLKRIYDQAIGRAGKVFQVLRIQSLNPGVLDGSMRLYTASMMADSPLGRAQREALATAVSRANDCHY
jgi:alkylhydroperoxidase family enzyme